jgi:hypothetical protein
VVCTSTRGRATREGAEGAQGLGARGDRGEGQACIIPNSETTVLCFRLSPRLVGQFEFRLVGTALSHHTDDLPGNVGSSF